MPPQVVAISRAPSDSANLTKAIMNHAPGENPGNARPKSRSNRIVPEMPMQPITMQVQLSRARCEVESLRNLKTENREHLAVFLAFKVI
jgi:hypothetical protein